MLSILSCLPGQTPLPELPSSGGPSSDGSHFLVPGRVDFGGRLAGPAERVWSAALRAPRREAAPGRLAVLCVFSWPEISTSCSPLILHRSCFLSPQYPGCFPASPPTGRRPCASEFPGLLSSLGRLRSAPVLLSGHVPRGSSRPRRKAVLGGRRQGCARGLVPRASPGERQTAPARPRFPVAGPRTRGFRRAWGRVSVAV